MAYKTMGTVLLQKGHCDASGQTTNTQNNAMERSGTSKTAAKQRPPPPAPIIVHDDSILKKNLYIRPALSSSQVLGMIALSLHQ